MNSKTNPDGKIYKPENLDSPFLEKHDSLFSAASVCHGVCHEKMPELLKEAKPTSTLKKRSSSVTPCVSAGSKRRCAARGEAGFGLGSIDQQRHLSSLDAFEDLAPHHSAELIMLVEGNFLPLP